MPISEQHLTKPQTLLELSTVAGRLSEREMESGNSRKSLLYMRISCDLAQLYRLCVDEMKEKSHQYVHNIDDDGGDGWV
jgi:hypothetical protein